MCKFGRVGIARKKRQSVRELGCVALSAACVLISGPTLVMRIVDAIAPSCSWPVGCSRRLFVVHRAIVRRKTQSMGYQRDQSSRSVHDQGQEHNIERTSRSY